MEFIDKAFAAIFKNYPRLVENYQHNGEEEEYLRLPMKIRAGIESGDAHLAVRAMEQIREQGIEVSSYTRDHIDQVFQIFNNQKNKSKKGRLVL